MRWQEVGQFLALGSEILEEILTQILLNESNERVTMATDKERAK